MGLDAAGAVRGITVYDSRSGPGFQASARVRVLPGAASGAVNLPCCPGVEPAVRLLLLPLLALAATALPQSAMAGSLYRCKGAGGETAFTSSREGYTDCRLIQTVPDPEPVKPAAANAPAAPSAKVEFRTAAGEQAPVEPARSESADRVTRGAVYRYMKDGVAHYTNRRPAGVQAKVLFTYIESCFACNVSSAVDFHSVALRTDVFVDEIARAASTHGVDPAFVRAVIHAESAFNPNAMSNKGAQGLMQLMPATAERFGVSDPFTPAQNIDGGTRYLGWLLQRFNGDTRLAAAAYNSGEGSVDRFGGVPPYDETQVFVERVGILHQRYAAALASAGPASVAASAGAR